MVGQCQYVPCQLLHVGGVVVDGGAYFLCHGAADDLSGLLKSLHDEWHPLVGWNGFQEEHVAKLVERHLTAVEQIGHEVLLAAEEAVAHMLLMLPHAAYGFLDVERVGHLADLLKLVYAHNDADAALLGYALRQVEYLLWGIGALADAQRQSELGIWLRIVDNLRCDAEEELSGVFKHFLHFCRCCPDDGRRKLFVELVLCATSVYVHIDHLELGVVYHAHDFLD